MHAPPCLERTDSQLTTHPAPLSITPRPRTCPLYAVACIAVSLTAGRPQAPRAASARRRAFRSPLGHVTAQNTNTDGAFGMRGAGDANPRQISGAAAPPLGCAARTLRAPCLLSVDLRLVGGSHVQSCSSMHDRHDCHGQAIVGTRHLAGRSAHAIIGCNLRLY
jgi:hypothetical protein